jgi:hypothetical protein
VFGNHLHLLSLWLFVLQPLLIIIEPWFQSFVISSSPTCIIFVAVSSSTAFPLLTEQNMYWNTPPSWSLWNYLSNEPSYAWNGFRTRELWLFYSGDAICPRLISDRAALNVSAIYPCTGLENW